MIGKAGKIIISAICGTGALVGVTAAEVNISNQRTAPPSSSIQTRVTTDENNIHNTSQKTEPVIATKEETEEFIIPYTTSYTDDSTLAKGQTKVTRAGVNGKGIKHYRVTYEDGIEKSRELLSTETTEEPTVENIARGTYVAPTPQSQPSSTQPTTSNASSSSSSTSTSTQTCANGTYINSSGNTVCRPTTTQGTGATAICKDGTYSYSQSRRGTCSKHGGVRQWL